MKPWVPKTLIVLGIMLGTIALLFYSCGPTIGYWRFTARSPAYYARIAEACDDLLAQHAGDLPSKMTGSKLESLPTRLRDLGPSFVMVDTNCVSLLIGGGFDSYHVLWVSSESERSLWLLKVYREGRGSQIKFSKTKGPS